MTPFYEKPQPCQGERGLGCSNPAHDHKGDPQDVHGYGPAGEMICHDCGAPLFYDEPTARYWHTLAGTPACFLAETAP